jgi:hypothetical protein
MANRHCTELIYLLCLKCFISSYLTLTGYVRKKTFDQKNMWKYRTRSVNEPFNSPKRYVLERYIKILTPRPYQVRTCVNSIGHLNHHVSIELSLVSTPLNQACQKTLAFVAWAYHGYPASTPALAIGVGAGTEVVTCRTLLFTTVFELTPRLPMSALRMTERGSLFISVDVRDLQTDLHADLLRTMLGMA